MRRPFHDSKYSRCGSITLSICGVKRYWQRRFCRYGRLIFLRGKLVFAALTAWVLVYFIVMSTRSQTDSRYHDLDRAFFSGHELRRDATDTWIELHGEDSWLLNQLFTAPKGSLTPCRHITGKSYTTRLSRARSLCLNHARCSSFSRHRITGRTLLCESTYTKKFKWTYPFVPRFWSNQDLGGCRDLHNEKVAVLDLSDQHVMYESTTACAILGVADYQFHNAEIANCHVLRTLETDSLQSACLKCDAEPKCLKFYRVPSGKTIMCQNIYSGGQGEQRAADSHYLATSSVLGVRIQHSIGSRAHHSKHDVPRHRFHLILSDIMCDKSQVLMDGVLTESLEHAKMICSAEPHCTTLRRKNLTRSTMFCQGYSNIRSSPLREPSVVGLKAGCEHYSGEKSYKEALASVTPTCSVPHHAGCPAGLYHVEKSASAVVEMPMETICDECLPNGVCPSLFPDSIQPNNLPGHFGSALQEAAQKILSKNSKDKFGVINPSVFTDGDRHYVVARVTNALRCRGISRDMTWQLDASSKTYHSFLLMCTLDNNSLSIFSDTCHVYQEDIDKFRIGNFDRMEYRIDTDSAFSGLEDPRGFVFRGNVHFLCNVGVEHLSRNPLVRELFPRGTFLRRMLLLTLTPDGKSWRNVMMIDIPGIDRGDQKNIVPIVTRQNIFLVYSILPFKLCKLNVETGLCDPIRLHSYLNDNVRRHLREVNAFENELGALGTWRGSTQFVHTPRGFLGLIHRKQDLQLGRIYTHKWMMLSSSFPHVPIWISKPFRFASEPSLQAFTRYDDIQFASGITYSSETDLAYVSYGLSDCVSALAIHRAPSSEEMQKGHLQVIGTSVDETPKNGIHVRWEGPVTDFSGFASAAREICRMLVSSPGVTLTILNVNADDGAVKDPHYYHKIYSHIAKSNVDLRTHPDVTIRFHWPPNFQRVRAGKLVIYFPWEFFSIPHTWAALLTKNADEVWVPSQRVKSGLTSSGVPKLNSQVVPHGIDCENIPELKTTATLRGDRVFRILFHGGLLWRKGVDILLQAYASAFDTSDDVELIIHSVYGKPEVRKYVNEFLKSEHVAPIRTFAVPLSDVELSALYLECDLLFHVSRSEGFGMSILESMAHGLPVVVLDAPPMTDFVNSNNGFVIRSRETVCDRSPCYVNGTVFASNDFVSYEPLTWYDVEIADVANLFREVHNDRRSLKKKRKQAKTDACKNWTWKRSHGIVADRISYLAANH